MDWRALALLPGDSKPFCLAGSAYTQGCRHALWVGDAGEARFATEKRSRHYMRRLPSHRRW